MSNAAGHTGGHSFDTFDDAELCGKGCGQARTQIAAARIARAGNRTAPKSEAEMFADEQQRQIVNASRRERRWLVGR